MNRQDLITIIDRINNNNMEENKKKKILDMIILYENYVDLSPISLINVIDEFIKLEKLGFLDKIDDNLFILLKNILGKKSEKKLTDDESLYILDYINYLVIPYNIIDCEKEYNLVKFLGEFEIMVSYIEEDDSFLDMEKLRNYNEDLYNILIFRIDWIMKNINNDNLKNGDYQDQVLMETILAHLMTIYYFSLDKYEKNINILKNAYDIVLDNIDKVKEYCIDNHLYNDIISNGLILDNNIIDEFKYCRDILDGLMEKNKKKVKK